MFSPLLAPRLYLTSRDVCPTLPELMGWVSEVGSLVYIVGSKCLPFAEGVHAYAWKGLACPQSMALCQDLPGALETRVTFSEDMYNLSALIAMSASGGAPCDEVGC